MEQFCKVEICGIAGMVYEQTVNGFRVVRMSVAVTEDFGGCQATRWWQLVWWPDKSDTRTFSRGESIHAEGRITYNEYMKEGGSTGRAYEIKARKIW